MNTDRLKAKALTVGDNPKWVEGYYNACGFKLSTGVAHFISHIFSAYDEINPDTLCQCTGYNDSNDDLIYGGDVLGDGSELHGGSRWGAVVVWKDGAWRVKLERGKKSTYLLTEWLEMRKLAGTPEFVVHNIHDPKE